MSIKTRDIEELINKHGFEQGMRKSVLLLSEAVVAQQEALQDMAQTIDSWGHIAETIMEVQGAQVGVVEQVRKKLGMDIDDSDAGPVADIGKPQ